MAILFTQAVAVFVYFFHSWRSKFSISITSLLPKELLLSFLLEQDFCYEFY